VALRQSGWPEGEFQTAPDACSEPLSRRPFPTVDPSVDGFGTCPWPTAEEIRSLMVVAGSR